jgi:hypothetical protein
VGLFLVVFAGTQDVNNRGKIINKNIICFICSLSQIIVVKTKRINKKFRKDSLRNFSYLKIVC